MRKYNYLQAFVLAFYSAELYRDVAKNWRGSGLGYLLALIILCLLIMGISLYRLQQSINILIQNVAPAIMTQLPEMEIKQHELIVHAQMPYVIKDQKTAKPLAVIDTTGKTKSIEQAGAVILVNKTEVIFVNKMTQQLSNISFANAPDVKITKELINQNLTDLQHSLITASMMLGIFYCLVLSLMLSIFTMVCAKLQRVALTYKVLYRLTCVAMTPSLILLALLTLANIVVPSLTLCLYLLSILYIYFAVRANKNMIQTDLVVKEI